MAKWALRKAGKQVDEERGSVGVIITWWHRVQGKRRSDGINWSGDGA
jgi:hypothetical protein